MGSEMSRSYVYHAATKWAEGAGTETIEEAARMAKACSSEQFAGKRAIEPCSFTEVLGLPMTAMLSFSCVARCGTSTSGAMTDTSVGDWQRRY